MPFIWRLSFDKLIRQVDGKWIRRILDFLDDAIADDESHHTTDNHHSAELIFCRRCFCKQHSTSAGENHSHCQTSEEYHDAKEHLRIQWVVEVESADHHDSCDHNPCNRPLVSPDGKKRRPIQPKQKLSHLKSSQKLKKSAISSIPYLYSLSNHVFLYGSLR